ncbi:hypothetical protein CKA32_004571 [Geitlerinema sp. FC II]|nr:hypothetical protein CKA32_004571 [Geitlerinema sp. FC II]
MKRQAPEISEIPGVLKRWRRSPNPKTPIGSREVSRPLL